MQTQAPRMLLSAIALAVTFGSANAVQAAPPADNPWKSAVCCRIDGWDWLAPSYRACRKQNGKLISYKSCRFGKANNGSRARSSASTNHSAPAPKARTAGPRARSHASTHGAGGKPPARNHRGNPATKPNGSGTKPNSAPNLPAGCKPRMSAMRVGALNKQLGVESARLSWQVTAQAAYGLKYKYKHAMHRQENCTKSGATFTCKVWAYPCPPS